MQYIKVCEEREGREGEEEGKREGKGGRDGMGRGEGYISQHTVNTVYQCPQSLYRLV